MTEFTRRVKVMMYYQDKYDSLNNSLIQNYSEDTATKLSQTKQTLVRQRSKVRKMIHENLNKTKMNLIKKLFKQRNAFLANGTEVREGDEVSFVNSDGIKCTGKIKRREDGTLFFWNSRFNIDDYTSAEKEVR